MKKEKKKIYYTKDILKLEVAEELGLLDKVKIGGWGELTAEESGKIGGFMTKKMKEKGWL